MREWLLSCNAVLWITAHKFYVFFFRAIEVVGGSKIVVVTGYYCDIDYVNGRFWSVIKTILGCHVQIGL